MVTTMTAPPRPGGWRRGPSATWSRFRSTTAMMTPSDPLEQYGLPSKGETRLNDHKAQEAFYDKIVERYMKFCAAAGTGDELDRRFAALSLNTEEGQQPGTETVAAVPVAGDTSTTSSKSPASPSSSRTGQISDTSTTTTIAKQSTTGSKSTANVSTCPSSSSTSSTLPSTASHNINNTTTTTKTSAELALLLSAMRKLRESIVATRRHDTFAQRAYIFVIHAGLLANHMETYHPALLYLLHHIHPRNPLPPPDLHEFASYRVLDLACRQSDLSAAYTARAHYYNNSENDNNNNNNNNNSNNYRDRRVDAVLKALAHDNWVAFWRVRRQVDGYQKRLLDWACAPLRLHALKCLGRSYLVVERKYVERCAGGRKWDDLVRLDRVGWELVPAAMGMAEAGPDSGKSQLESKSGPGPGSGSGSGIEKVIIRRPKAK